ncbi:HD domain-containing protein [Daejeonella lutea]|uniref:HD domain-containing protein n=1 Tax=Daejeonella lutea TaxID=572036 RepID=A0A1T5AYF1_9SPHI|nr:HD domain-containing protein [Daejeonella lutea]SKB39996.1 HD domain-containing protein [Daejeonella lutea]
MLATEKLIPAVQSFVLKFLTENLPENLSFHNVNHTLEVVHAAKEISGQVELSEEQLRIIQVAAWFHDCGYARAYTGHENFSKEIAAEFLTEQDYGESFIKQVQDCIEATRYPQKPHTMEARILCDADLYHFTKPDYHCYEIALRSELEIYFKNKYTDPQWARINCSMLEHHEYFTDYGKDILQQFKAINMERMRCLAVDNRAKK